MKVGKEIWMGRRESRFGEEGKWGISLHVLFILFWV